MSFDRFKVQYVLKGNKLFKMYQGRSHSLSFSIFLYLYIYLFLSDYLYLHLCLSATLYPSIFFLPSPSLSLARPITPQKQRTGSDYRARQNPQEQPCVTGEVCSSLLANLSHLLYLDGKMLRNASSQNSTTARRKNSLALHGLQCVVKKRNLHHGR